MIVTDGFQRANAAVLGNADTGQPWVMRPTAPLAPLGPPFVYIAQVPSVLGIASNRLTGFDSSRVHLATIDHGIADVNAVLTLALPFSPGSGAGMVVRWAGAAQFYVVVIYRRIDFPQNYYVVVHRVDGPTSVAEVVSGNTHGELAYVAPDSAAGAHTFGVVVTGNTWRFSWDGILNPTVAFSSQYNTATNHGVLQYFSVANIVEAYNGEASPLLGGGWSLAGLAVQ